MISKYLKILTLNPPQFYPFNNLTIDFLEELSKILLKSHDARKFNVVSEFGKQLDSFADFVSFCILPSLVLYFYLGNTAENIIVKYLPLLIIIFSALRLAKFNITENNNNYFDSGKVLAANPNLHKEIIETLKGKI